MCFPLFLFEYAIPFSAVLSLSEPQLVKYISSGLQFINDATLLLASSIALFALLPILYKDDGFPYSLLRYGNISFNTSSFILVVALLSKYLTSIISSFPFD